MPKFRARINRLRSIGQRTDMRDTVLLCKCGDALWGVQTGGLN